MTAWDAERWHAATGELDQMLGQSAAERAAALDALRARDPRLADDVARLLRDHESAQAGGFLEQGPDALLTTAPAPDGDAGPRPRPSAALPPGAEFGGYRVRRVLGRGGMGLVYEAEEIESGRRVALKVLEQRFGDERERERFEREGRLAASIDHEHCVFVFGAAEIEGVPAIAMELMQGTLADRLTAAGPLAPAAAVDVALQLVAGLQAAAEAGILHRDVKPSNCFVDADGVVKIGDFGISRSLRPAEETALSTRNRLAATPTYASPEQLRGATLDARADIYSLGATLYELVTGRRPFTAPDLMSLLMAVANDAPAPPHTVVPAVPRGLSRVILRCLAKRPEDRYASYAALAAALEPYASVSPTPATLGRRLVAGVVDYMAVGLLNVPIILLLVVPTMAAPTWRQSMTTMIASFSLVLLYYGGSEALWARTAGKALLGLALVDGSGRPPRPAVAFARAFLFASPNILLGLGVLTIWGGGLAAQTQNVGRINAFTIIGQWLILVTLFAAARRRNGYAALHDLATGIRVVERRVSTGSERPATTTGAAARRRARHRASRIVRRARRHDRGPARVAAGPRRAAAATGVDPRRADRHAARPRGADRAAAADAPAVARRPPDDAGSLGRLRRCRRRADREGVPGAPVVVGGAALAGGPRPRAGGAAAGRPSAARSGSRLDPGLGASQAARRSDRRRPDCRRPVTVRPAHVRRRAPARGRASGARRRPPAVAGRGIAVRHPVVGGTAGRDDRGHAGRGRAAARPGRGDARLAHPVARGPHRVAHADGRHGREHHGDALPAGAQRPRRDPSGDVHAARAGSAQRPEGPRAGRS